MEEDQSHDNWYSQVQLSQFFFLTPKTFKIIFEHKKIKSHEKWMVSRFKSKF